MPSWYPLCTAGIDNKERHVFKMVTVCVMCNAICHEPGELPGGEVFSGDEHWFLDAR